MTADARAEKARAKANGKSKAEDNADAVATAGKAVDAARTAAAAEEIDFWAVVTTAESIPPN